MQRIVRRAGVAAARQILWGLSVLSPGATQPGAEPSLSAPAVLQIGEQPCGNPIHRLVRLFNADERTVTVVKVIPSCGCLSARLDRKTIPPGSFAVLSCDMKVPLAPGPFEREIDVAVDRGRSPRIAVRGVGSSRIRVGPGSICRFKPSAAGAMAARLELRSSDDESYCIGEVIPSDPRISSTFDRGARCSHAIELELAGSADSAETTGLIRISVSHPRQRFLVVPFVVPARR